MKAVGYKRVECVSCRSSYPLIEEDNPNDWEEGCTVCGGRNWRTVEHISMNIEAKDDRETTQLMILKAIQASADTAKLQIEMLKKASAALQELQDRMDHMEVNLRDLAFEFTKLKKELQP